MKVTIPIKYDNYNTNIKQGLEIKKHKGSVSLTMSGEYGDRTIEVNDKDLRKVIEILSD